MSRSFFVNEQDIEVDDIVVVEQEEFHHLSSVLRLGVGDEVVIYNNSDFEYMGVINSISKKSAEIKITHKQICNGNPTRKIDVFVASLKNDKFESLIPKMSELGVRNFTTFSSRFVTSKIIDKGERWTKIAKDSAKQCKRSKMIEVKSPLTFSQVVEALKSFDKVIVAYENEKNYMINDCNFATGGSLALIIGSEGGFSAEEIDAFGSINAEIVSLGSRILRAETAVIVVTAVASFCGK